MTLQDITTERLTEKGVHVIDGIAGAAKTSRSVSVLSGVEYVHATSTNKLRRDIERRFHHPAVTIAGGLFQTVSMNFYEKEKSVDVPVVLIDEILQADPRVFDWVDHNSDDRSVVICTDSKQMLTPGGGSECLRRFEELKTRADDIELSYSYRPVNNVSRETFDTAYAADPDGFELFELLRDRADVADISDIQYDPADAFITHTNESERQIYDFFGLRYRYDVELIPKGVISGRNHVGTPEKYPIMPQADADGKLLGYWQIGNVGSVVRYQGTEIQPGRKCFFIIPPGAVISNRECYTMITRCKDVRDIVIVELSPERDAPRLVSFNGKPIDKKKELIIRNGMKLSDGRDAMTSEIKQKDYSELLRKANRTAPAGVWYDGIRRKGKTVSAYAPVEKSNKTTLYSLLRKEPELSLQKINLFYRAIDSVHCGAPQIITPVNMDNKVTMCSEYKYGIDLYSAYPHVWALEGVPDGRTYRTDDSGEESIYITTSDSYGKPGTLITGSYYRYMTEHGADLPVAFVGSVDYFHEDKIGAYLLKQAFRSVESKIDLKGIHYGYLQKRYVEIARRDRGEIESYIINDKSRYELVMVFIQSGLSRIISSIKYCIYGNVCSGRTLVDCLYFNYNGDIQELGKKIEETIPEYHFRIFENTGTGKTSEKPILYKNYKDLPTEKERRREADAQRKRLERAKKHE